jgi:hypothetical protein
MKRHFLYSILVLMLSLVAATAMAEQCKPVNGQLGAIDVFLEDDPECKLDDMTFYYCIERPTLGTLAGRYRFYSAPWLNGWDLRVPRKSLGGVRWWIGVSYAISVFETQQGTLFTQETGVWHYDAEVGLANHFNITGGTGHYDGATGWMAAAGTGYGMTLVGELCTP